MDPKSHHRRNIYPYFYHKILCPIYKVLFYTNEGFWPLSSLPLICKVFYIERVSREFLVLCVAPSLSSGKRYWQSPDKKGVFIPRVLWRSLDSFIDRRLVGAGVRVCVGATLSVLSCKLNIKYLVRLNTSLTPEGK